MRYASSLALLVCLGTGIGIACSSNPIGTGGAGTGGAHDGGTGPVDASYDVVVIPPPDGSIVHPCDLPGSVQFTTSGTVTVSGGDPSWPSLAFLHLPMGFCAHYFGTVGNTRQLRFAPGGELFVASPTGSTTGGGQGGKSAIVILPDDNLDGVADTPVTFLSGLPYTQGMMFTPGYFYYQDTNPTDPKGYVGTLVKKMPYTSGQRSPSAPSSVATVANITYYSSPLHWPKTLDVADDGSIYVGNGGDQGESCVQPHPFHGGIRKIDPSNVNGDPIAQGFRNPISVRCGRGHNQCFALELALDYSYTSGGREKMVPIHEGDDWGFPCCATANLPYPGAPSGTNCAGVAQDTNSFTIGDTPFDMDFEQGFWPGMWNRRAYVVLHGAAGSWTGARMVAIPMDPTTGLPSPSNDVNNTQSDGPDVGMSDFATGWDVPSGPGHLANGRPSSVAFAPDGRLFVGDDANGIIFWIAPITQ